MTIATLPVNRADAAVEQYTTLHAEPVNPTGGRLVAWSEAARAAASLGVSLSKTSFVPKDFRGKPEECTAAILFGDEIGLSPMQALQAVFVVSGRPGMYARAMVAVVLAAGHEVETVSKTDAKVVVRGRRRGSETWTEETWTTERARRAGYTNNKRYELDPQSMLYARAAADVCRQIAPDALAGLAYTVEELQLDVPAPTTRVTRGNVQATVGMRRAVEAAPEPVEPAFDDDPAAVDTQTGEITDQAPAIPPATTAQLKRLGMLFTDAGVTDRAERLALVSGIVGRDVSSSKDLDKAEASAVINSLAADAAALVEPVEPTFDEDGAA